MDNKINAYLYLSLFLNVIKKYVIKKCDLHTDVTPQAPHTHTFHNDQVCINPPLPSPKTY